MAEQRITVGDKAFDVACADGEEHLLHSAAALLDGEAQAVLEQAGRMPEGRLLLMAGLMLADRMVAMESRLSAAQSRVALLEAELEALKSAPPPEPLRVEVPVIPEGVTDRLAEIAARAEALAAQMEERTG